MFIKYKCFNLINIYNATGSLNFTNVTAALDVNVFDSPGLEILSFPKLVDLYNFQVRQATSLSAISLPRITVGSYQSGGIKEMNFDITGVPALRELDYGDVDYLNSLILLDSGFIPFPGITVIKFLTTSVNASFPNLTSTSALEVSSIPLGSLVGHAFPHLTSVNDLTLADSHLAVYDLSPVQLDNITGSMLLKSLEYLESNSVDGEAYANSLDFSQTASIGQNANITSNTNVYMDFGGLTTIGGAFSIINNTNCSFNFNQLSRVGNLSMVDNINTILPFLSDLETADNIHIRGYLDTAPGANIFPSLKSVSGSVVVETWDPDFNCSKLVSQWRDSIIPTLRCNGTDNGTAQAAASPPNTPSPGMTDSGLTDAEWAGIGVAIGAIVLGSIFATAFLFLHYRRRRDEKAEPESPQEQQEIDVQPPDLSGLHEADRGLILREAPDSALCEMAVPPTEKPDDHLGELAVEPGEMPTHSPGAREIGRDGHFDR
ncbi:hypothetical protein F4803DRAFT_548670 [Xylaria telfairii]|nr:hypothetical protein F4803DRAFT_548670 [Xylaria telfairii]